MRDLTLTMSLILGLATSVNSQGLVNTPSTTSYFEGKEIKIGEQIICEEEMAKGFEWEDGGYRFTNYQRKKYLFTKQEHRTTVQSDCTGSIGDPKCLCPSFTKWGNKEDSHNYKDNSLPSYLHRCYLVQEGNRPVSSQECTEHYSDGKLIAVRCDKGTISFHPNQLFLRAPTGASKDVSMFPEDDYKDSYVIAHGSCRVMSY